MSNDTVGYSEDEGSNIQVRKGRGDRPLSQLFKVALGVATAVPLILALTCSGAQEVREKSDLTTRLAHRHASMPRSVTNLRRQLRALRHENADQRRIIAHLQNDNKRLLSSFSAAEHAFMSMVEDTKQLAKKFAELRQENNDLRANGDAQKP